MPRPAPTAAFASVIGLLLLHGCGIDVVGIGESVEAGVITPPVDAQVGTDAPSSSSSGSSSSSSGAEGGALVDAAADAPADAPIDTGPTCTCAAPPAGWELVAYAADQNTPCAAGLATDDRVTEPTATAAACSCGCNVTTTPSCNVGSFSMPKDTSTSALCDQAAQVFDTNNGNCIPFSLLIVSHRRVSGAPPSGPSACNAPGVPHTDKVTTKPVRVCRGDSADDCVCAPNGAFETCVRRAGQQTCPTGFTKQTIVGTSPDVSCTACTCSVTTTCSATVNHYSDNNCQTLVESFTDKSCDKEDATTVNSMKYVGVADAKCNPTSASAATPSLQGVETVCCAP